MVALVVIVCHKIFIGFSQLRWSGYSYSLPEYIPDDDNLIVHVQFLTEDRNENHRSVDGQFHVTDARVKLKRPYPSIPI
jgi:hypothetical protein